MRLVLAGTLQRIKCWLGWHQTVWEIYDPWWYDKQTCIHCGAYRFDNPYGDLGEWRGGERPKTKSVKSSEDVTRYTSGEPGETGDTGC